jgi:ElaB/YqjD/DUF883 family membrane-anchored ribosome-binding protein
MQANTHAHHGDSKERLGRDLHTLLSEADDLLQGAVRNGEQHLDASWSRLEAQLHQLRRQVDELQGDVLHRTRKAARLTDETVHAHPYAAMGLAGLAGVLLGVLVARR